MIKKISAAIVAIAVMAGLSAGVGGTEREQSTFHFRRDLTSFAELQYMVDNASDEDLQEYLHTAHRGWVSVNNRQELQDYIDAMRHMYVPILDGVEAEHLPFIGIQVSHNAFEFLWGSAVYGDVTYEVGLIFVIHERLYEWGDVDRALTIICAEGEIEYHLFGTREHPFIDDSVIFDFTFEVNGFTFMVEAYPYDSPEEALEDIKKFTLVRLDEMYLYAADDEPEPEPDEENPETALPLATTPLLAAGFAGIAAVSRRRRR
jgi:hypothetical protein